MIKHCLPIDIFFFVFQTSKIDFNGYFTEGMLKNLSLYSQTNSTDHGALLLPNATMHHSFL